MPWQSRAQGRPQSHHGCRAAQRREKWAGGRSAQPDESVLLEKITGDPPEMPLKEKPLSRQEVAGIRSWIESGADWPRGVVLQDRRLAGQRWWAFEPLRSPKAPRVKNRAWARDARRRVRLVRAGKARAEPEPGGGSPYPDSQAKLRPLGTASDSGGDRCVYRRPFPECLRIAGRSLAGEPPSW